MRILFLSRWFPYPANNGSKLRIYNLLRGLAQQHDLTLLSFVDQNDIKPDLAEVRSLCSSVYIIPWRKFDADSIRARLGFFSLRPRSVVDTFSSEMAEKIQQLGHTCDFELVIASQLDMAAYRPYFKNIPALFEEVEIGLSYDEAHNPSDGKKSLRRALTWLKLRMYLWQLLSSFQAYTIVSEQERQLLVSQFTGLSRIVEVIPNCVLTREYENQQSVAVQNRLIFSGSFRYHANYEAMLWFVREVFPHVLDEVPEAHLMVTGDHAGIPFPHAPNVTLVGHVEDIKSLVASSWVSVAPLLSGGGTRLKILESLALGTPVVSTSKGAEGLGAIDGKHLYVRDSACDFAAGVVKILKSTDLRESLSMNGLRWIKEHYDWESVIPRFLRLVEKTARKVSVEH